MEFARERISNWSGYAIFRQKLSEIGWGMFPVLQETLPNSNDGITDASSAEKAIEELEVFARQDLGTTTALVDAETSQVLMTFAAAYGGVFFTGPGWDGGVDADGFFIRQVPSSWLTKIGMKSRDTFRSKDFHQEQLAPRKVQVCDVGTGKVVV